jgi:hypothetical protein
MANLVEATLEADVHSKRGECRKTALCVCDRCGAKTAELPSLSNAQTRPTSVIRPSFSESSRIWNGAEM